MRRPATSIGWFWEWPIQWLMQLLDICKAVVTVAHIHVPVAYLGTASYEFLQFLHFWKSLELIYY